MNWTNGSQKIASWIRWRYQRYIYAFYHRLRSSHLNLPIIFGNSFPKSGTNLLWQILAGFVELGPFLDRKSCILTYVDHGENHKRSAHTISRDIQKLLPGEVAVGHLLATSRNMSMLVQPEFVNYFIYRDLRDVVVSHAFYVRDISNRHRLHRYYVEELCGLEECIQASILGVPQSVFEFADLRARFQPYWGWFECGQVMKIRFEEILLEPRRVIQQMLDHMSAAGYELAVNRDRALDVLVQSIRPEKSPTFRKGKIGAWRDHFTPEHKSMFKQVAGDLLIELGYERDNNW